jgi:hypothetical protein
MEYQFGFGTKDRLVEILPQRKFKLDVFWSHNKEKSREPL